MEKHRELFDNINALINKITERADKYSLTFEQKDFFTFSDAEERSKRYKREYLAFICDFNELYVQLSVHFDSVAQALLEADRDLDEQNIALFNSVFEKCLETEKELAAFTTTVEAETQKSNASVSVILNALKKFMLSFRVLSETLS